ncbi:PREDICTED: coiled-coil domain-containing protein 65-like [Dufourea novaeangliae]|uniref:coiled-coil domain-containing protein 65-like n=1 Tax=Dufourea novaeangliae TaxID=178035 RepID=UPI0007675860|nr:PREDICTED: coiled-coil domain-containing protein 65-like [Dufourea novaeangliae]
MFEEEKCTTKTRNAINTHNLLILEKDITSNLTHQSSENMENLWDQLHKTLTEYERVTKNKRKQYEYLKEQDNIYQLCILQYPKTHILLQNVIESLKHNIQVLTLKRKEQVANLKITDAVAKMKIKNIKQYFAMTQAIDFLQLKKLTVASNDVLKSLQKSMKKSSTILEIITVCSNLEPHFVYFKNYFMENEIRNLHSKTDQFWKQYNYIAADNILLRKGCNMLSLENKRLSCKLQTHVVAICGIPAMHSIVSTST